MVIKWSVESRYDFLRFEKADFYTTIDLSEGMTLKVPDGLSEYMVTLGIAQVFDYYAEWQEIWQTQE